MTEPTKLILLVEDDPDHELLTIRARKKSNIATPFESDATAKRPSSCSSPTAPSSPR